MILINFHTIVLRRKHSRTVETIWRSAPGRSCFFFYLATGTGSVQVVSLASRTFEGRYQYSPSVTELGFHCFCWRFFSFFSGAGENQKSRHDALSLSLKSKATNYPEYSNLAVVRDFGAEIPAKFVY